MQRDRAVLGELNQRERRSGPSGQAIVGAKTPPDGSRVIELVPDVAGMTGPVGFRVQAVDTTGAGDSFNAGFLHAWLRKVPLREAMLFAAACGALSTLGSGGTASQPTEPEATPVVDLMARLQESLSQGKNRARRAEKEPAEERRTRTPRGRRKTA